MQFPQEFPRTVGKVLAPTQKDILDEPIFRRASVGFARKNGGVIMREVLRQAESIRGLITERSRVMAHRSPTVGYPTPPHWHVDVMPGTPGSLEEQLERPTRGLIVNIHDNDVLPTTLFLRDGSVMLEQSPPDGFVYDGRSPLARGNEGDLYWYHPVIEQQIASSHVHVAQAKSNSLLAYDSTNFHKPPELGSIETLSYDVRFRLIIRINTPHEDGIHPLPEADDKLLPGNVYNFFTIKPGDPTKWVRHEMCR